VTELRNSAAESGVVNVFVAADNDDVHALDFYRALGGNASPVTLFTFAQARKGSVSSSTARPAGTHEGSRRIRRGTPG
jgi:aminoglycoside 3-N-acetyltransferase I